MSKRKKKKNKIIDYYIIIVLVLLVIVLISPLFIKKKAVVVEDKKIESEMVYDVVDAKGESVSLALNGDKVIKVKVNSDFKDPGFVAKSDEVGDLKDYVKVSSDVDTSKMGIYKIEYSIDYKTFVHTLTRKVLVYDTIGVKMNGGKDLYLPVGSEYSDLGLSITNSNGDDVSDICDVKSDINVDTSKVGEYFVKYYIKYDDIEKDVTRKVIVYDVLYDISVSNYNLTNNTITVNFKTDSEYFDHVVYNDKTSKNKSFHFDVYKNLNIKFTVYDIFGNYTSKDLVINNIDKNPPVGSCSGYIKDGVSNITLKSSDDVSFSHYVINGSKYTSNNIILKKEYSSISVDLYDKAGNKSTVSCNLVNKNVLKGELSYKNSHNYNYWINVPENTPVNSPLLIFLHGDGEVGSKNGTKNTYYMQKAIQYGGGNEKFIALAPITNVTDWSSSTLQKNLKGLIDEIVSTYKVDKNRIYIMGFSRGAIGTWGMISNYPGYFAAAIPVSCCAPSYFDARNASKTPVNAFVGGAESNYSGCMQSKVNNINSSGGNAKLNVIQGASHSSITTSLNYTEIFNWMLSNKKK